MSEIILGSEMLENYKGSLSIEAVEANVFVTNSNGQNIQPGIRVLPIDTYTITATPGADRSISSITVNGNDFINGNTYTLSFSDNLTIVVNTELDGANDFDNDGN